MRASIESKVTAVIQQGLVILLCGVLALGAYRFMSLIISVSPPLDEWDSCEPGLLRGWTVDINNPLDEIWKIEERI